MTDETAAETVPAFSAANLIDVFTQCQTTANSIPYVPFLTGCAEVEKLLGTHTAPFPGMNLSNPAAVLGWCRAHACLPRHCRV